MEKWLGAAVFPDTGRAKILVSERGIDMKPGKRIQTCVLQIYIQSDAELDLGSGPQIAEQ